MICIVVCCDE